MKRTLLKFDQIVEEIFDWTAACMEDDEADFDDDKEVTHTLKLCAEGMLYDSGMLMCEEMAEDIEEACTLDAFRKWLKETETNEN